MTERALTEIEIAGDHPLSAQDRLAYVFDLIERRREELNAQARAEGLPMTATRFAGPAFPVHVRRLPELLDDSVCTAHLEHLARNGARCGVVGLVYGDAEAVVDAATKHSTTVAAALIEGRALRMAPAAHTMPWQRQPTTTEVAEHYSEAVSAELWAALVTGDSASIAAVFTHVHSLGETPGGPTERRLVADCLRRAADILLPGAGGMLLPLVPCPFCIASPLVRMDEFPSHLLELHGSLAEARPSSWCHCVEAGYPGPHRPAEGCEARPREDPDDLINKLMSGMPDSWDGDEAAESLVVSYVREIERRLMAAGGSLARHPEEPE